MNASETPPNLIRSAIMKGWLLMATAVTVAGVSVAAASCFGGKRAGGALAAAEATVLACRVRKALAMRRVGPGRKLKV